jgi:ABC-2 type transport system ATP-binding protein
MIEVRDLRLRYFRKPVLKGVSFTMEKGQITCLAGLNGAGKSTVLKAIMGLVPLDGGSIRIDGTETALHLAGNRRDLNRFRVQHVSYIPDRLAMPPSMKLWEALRFMDDFYPGIWNGGKAKEMMTFFGLGERERIANLSKGNAAKFNLVLGLALDTPYVLMDEPFSGIDLFSREAIAEVFSNSWLEDRGVLITTHEIQEVEHLIDKMVMLKDGVVAMAFDSEEMRLAENKSIIDVMREVYRP